MAVLATAGVASTLIAPPIASNRIGAIPLASPFKFVTIVFAATLAAMRIAFARPFARAMGFAQTLAGLVHFPFAPAAVSTFFAALSAAPASTLVAADVTFYAGFSIAVASAAGTFAFSSAANAVATFSAVLPNTFAPFAGAGTLTALSVVALADIADARASARPVIKITCIIVVFMFEPKKNFK